MPAIPKYQQDFLAWAKSAVDPTIDMHAPGAYEGARRRLWFGQRDQVIRFMAAGAGLGPEQASLAIERLGQFTHEENLKMTGWLLGSDDENQKLKCIGALGQNDLFSFLQGTLFGPQPKTFLATSKLSQPPDIGNLDSLPKIEALLDYWEIEVRAYSEVVVSWCQSELALRATEEKANSGIGQWLGRALRRIAGFPKAQRVDPASFTAMIEEHRAGSSLLHTDFLAKLGTLRASALQAKEKLLKFERLNNNPNLPEEEVLATLEAGRMGLQLCQTKLVSFQPSLALYISDRAELEQYISENQSAAQSLRQQASKSWLQSSLTAVVKGVGALGARVGKSLSDPNNLLEVFKAGLEIAGAVATGGGSMVLRISLWVANMIQKVQGTVTSFRQLAKSIAGLDMASLKNLFTAPGLVGSLVKALFGEQVVALPSPASSEKSIAEPEVATQVDAGKAGGKLQKLVKAIAGSARAMAGSFHAVAGKASRLFDSLDLTRFPFFRRMLSAIAAIAGVSQAQARKPLTAKIAQGFRGIHHRLGAFFSNLEETLGKPLAKVKGALADLGDPRTLTAQLANRALDFILGMLIFNPPSAVLKLVLKPFRSLGDTDLVQVLRSRLPMLDSGIDLLAKSQLVQSLFSPLEPPVQKLGGALAGLENGAKGLVSPIESAFAGAFDKPEILAEKVVDKILGQEGPKKKDTSPLPFVPQSQRHLRFARQPNLEPADRLSGAVISSAENAMNRSTGKPLEPQVGAEISEAIGHDFSKVQVHDNPASHQAAGLLNARAMAHGNDIFFDAGEYDAHSRGGRELLAHELTHVAQQSTATGRPDGQGLSSKVKERSPGKVVARSEKKSSKSILSLFFERLLGTARKRRKKRERALDLLGTYKKEGSRGVTTDLPYDRDFRAQARKTMWRTWKKNKILRDLHEASRRYQKKIGQLKKALQKGKSISSEKYEKICQELQESLEQILERFKEDSGLDIKILGKGEVGLRVHGKENEKDTGSFRAQKGALALEKQLFDANPAGLLEELVHELSFYYTLREEGEILRATLPEEKQGDVGRQHTTTSFWVETLVDFGPKALRGRDPY